MSLFLFSSTIATVETVDRRIRAHTSVELMNVERNSLLRAHLRPNQLLALSPLNLPVALALGHMQERLVDFVPLHPVFYA